MAARAQNFVCQNCGAAYRALGRQLRSLRRVEYARRGRRREAPRAPSRKGRLFAIEPLKGETA